MYQYKKTIHLLKSTLCGIILLLAVLPSFAQSGKLFDTDNQLSSSFVTQVMEDSKGFIWVATRNGLNVYDGYNFTTFSKDKNDNRGFCNNYINCLGEDKQEHVIIGTNNGVMVYDRKRFKSLAMKRDGKDVKCYVNCIITRKDGTVWAGTSGYGMMQISHNLTCCESLGGVLKPYTYIYYAMEDHLGRMWIVTEDFQLLRLEKNGSLTRNIPGTKGLKVKDLAEDKHGNIIIATEQQGIYVMNNGSHSFNHLQAVDLPVIDQIYVTRNNQLYVGSNGYGILRYNLNTGELQRNPFLSYQVNLNKAKVNSIIEDKHGNIWFTMLQKGVYMQPNKNYDFGYMGFRLGTHNLIGDNCTTSIIQGHDGKIWIGTDKDNLYSLSMGKPTTTRHYENVPSTVLALCEDKKGNIWIGSFREGVGYLDHTGTYHKADLKAGSDISVFDIKCDPQGNLWFATMGSGLIRLGADQSVRHYTMSPDADSNPKTNSLPNNYLAKMAFSKDYSKLYIASSIGLSCLDIKRDSWVSAFGLNCLNKGSFSHCVQTDRRGRVWYGTEDGIFVYDLKDIGHPTRYTIDNGLSNNGIAFIAEDANGKMWVGTTHGLNSINPETDNIRIYYVESGLQSNEFSDGAAFTNPSGNFILMGGTGGINWFNPLTIKQHAMTLDVFISNFTVNNTNVYPGQESGFFTITDKPVYSSDCFHLSHEDNSFSLQLSTFTYNDVEQISYAYSINDEEWQTLKPGQNEIAFSHMPAGTYTFRVKAISNGQESGIREFRIIVSPIWYASIWARILYLLVFGVLVYLYIRHRRKKEQDRLLLQQHIHAEEMGEAKLKFFMNISHEIRTPLTLIITPLLSLMKEDKNPHRQSIYDIIRKNSERILHLINQMMDLRKIDKGQMVMHMAETDMVSFLRDEYELFRQQALSKKIDFQFVYDAEQQPLWIDRNNFDKVIMNILSNAFKFTPAGGKILMSLSHTKDHVYISIKDNGIGISEDKLETIFERFYQSPTSSNDGNIGTGIGLDLTRSLVELHYGTIVVHNNKGLAGDDFAHGSEFVIRLPLGHEHLKPEEIAAPADADDSRQNIFEEDNDELLEDITPEPAAGKTRSTKSHIVIVEDDDAILEYLQAQLQADFHISIFHNGREALPEIIRQQPNLVISDIMMPEMDGTTLCTKLKSNINTNHIPVILLTAMSREEDQLNGLQTGADAYIVKPFNMDILRRTILNLLALRRTLRNKFEGKEGNEDQLKKVKVQSADDLLMERIMQVINDNMTDEELSVEMIAQQVGISRVHLHRKMKELTNQTPHTFIRNIRLKQAAKLLRESGKNVTEVMYLCGFSNPASFSTMFKSLYGCSPRDYANSHSKEKE